MFCAGHGTLAHWRDLVRGRAPGGIDGGVLRRADYGFDLFAGALIAKASLVLVWYHGFMAESACS